MKCPAISYQFILCKITYMLIKINLINNDMHRRGSLLRCDNSQIDLDENGVHLMKKAYVAETSCDQLVSIYSAV